MNKLIVANWKMNPSSESEAIQLAKASDEKGVVVCPPFPFLGAVKNALRKADLGAQDVFWQNPIPGGAFTGEVSISMLKKIGASYVILGHSERRNYLGETDEIINQKVKSALAFGLKVILCVGESLSTRREGLSQAESFVKNQITKDLKGIPSSVISSKSLVIAYEPIWAIGTGKADKPEDSASMAAYIKDFLKPKTSNLKPNVLYGGSVTSLNAARIFEHQEIDGALVGGASLKTEEFKKIIKIASK
ncbi:MAG: triose-phosphate isomerase [Candidatus Liptonbacteria bacterium]|nr:triose-phosphate isomerase [Candidatus Liptonbacteria bacterium]